MLGWARRGLTVASATWALAGAGCGEPSGSAATDTEVGGSSSSGAELDGSGTTEAEPRACTPGEVRACYDGPPGTEGQGACAAGQQTCTPDGRGFTECAGQVWPEPAERCDTPQDDDCDGLTVCEPTLEWSRTLPGYVTHVAALGDGGAVVAGTDANYAFDGENLVGMFVVALDAEGVLRWAHSVGNRAFVWPGMLAVDASGAVVVGGAYEGSPDFGGGPLPWTSLGFRAFAARYDAEGAHVWSHARMADGYFAAAFGPDGTTYLAGGHLYDEVDPELAGAQLHVMALAPDGSVAWILAGKGSWSSSPISLFTTATGELVLVATTNGSGAELGGVPIDGPPGLRPIVARIGADGTLSGHHGPFDGRVTGTAYETRAFARPGGALAVATVALLQDDGHVAAGGLVVALDEAFAPVTQHFLGDETWPGAIAPHPDGSTLLALEFSGLLDLGPIGVGLSGPAVVAVDDEGRGRWAEVLRSPSGQDLMGVAAAPDGAVLVAGYVGNGIGTLAGAEVTGSFVAKLRP